MPISLPILLAGAGVLNGILKSQQYYPAAEAPSRAQIYGDILGGGLGGLLGGSQLGGDPLGILAGLGVNRPQDIRAEDVVLPTTGFDKAYKEHIPIEQFGRAERSQQQQVLDLLAGTGIAGTGINVGGQAQRGQAGGNDFSNLINQLALQGLVG